MPYGTLNSYGMLNRRLTREAQQAIRFIFFLNEGLYPLHREHTCNNTILH